MDHNKNTTYNEARKISIMKWRAKNRESYNEICRLATKTYYQKNKEVVKAKTRARYHRNKQQQHEQQQQQITTIQDGNDAAVL